LEDVFIIRVFATALQHAEERDNPFIFLAKILVLFVALGELGNEITILNQSERF
jgi:hypothetical protein